MYYLTYNKRKEYNNSYVRQIQLYNEDNRQYIASVTRKDVPIEKLLEMLKIKVLQMDLVLDWDQLCFNLLYTKCGWCGNYFKSINKKVKYCSKECASKAKLEQNREHNRKNFKLQKEMNRKIIAETISNKGYLPTTFQEIDDVRNLGNSNLTKHKADDDDKEFELIQKEMKRLKLK